jgi:hypothetical protein
MKASIFTKCLLFTLLIFLFVNHSFAESYSQVKLNEASPDTVKILFIGNSFTGRFNIPDLLKSIVEGSHPEIVYIISRQIYGGRSLADHWKLGTQNFISQKTLTIKEEQAVISSLKNMNSSDPLFKYRDDALGRHSTLLGKIGSSDLIRYDMVVLQSWNDDLNGDNSQFIEYALKFGNIVKAHEGHIIIYETTPKTQNTKPLTSPPTNLDDVVSKTKSIIRLAEKLDASVIPMALVAYLCQTDRPDFTLRYTNDIHLNQVMAYLTVCTFYGALMEESPEGLPLDRITDPKRNNEMVIFSEKDRLDLQRVVWKSLSDFDDLMSSTEEI